MPPIRSLLPWVFPGLAGLILAGTGFGADEPARPLRDLNKSYFPFTPVRDRDEWESRRAEIRRRVLVASGLWPMPERTPLQAVIHGRIERADYTVEKVIFESLPGHFVTGNLYLPKNRGEKIPGVICPHGHWPNGRFMHASDAEVRKQIEMGAEKLENAARSPLQARCVQLARMGCAVFFYDMLGYADSVQFCDSSGNPEHRHGVQERGFLSVAAEANLQGYFQLQTWNSVRALDFIASLPFVDRTRIGCTGASGGGTQTMIISGIDERVAASFPCVMVSTAMQGGCTCENANLLRINQGNIDIAALTSPRPQGLTAADDWTKELETKGFPDLKNLYAMLGVPDRMEAHFNVRFPHNYNAVSRAQMYAFFNRHFGLGLPAAELEERDFTLSTTAELTVWDENHPRPAAERTGIAHEVAVCGWFSEQAAAQVGPLLAPRTAADVERAREVLGGALDVMIGRRLPAKGEAAFALGTKEDRGDHLLMRGVTTYKGESVDGTFVYPKNWSNTVVLWLSLKGEASIVNANGELTPPARRLLAEGYAIACPRPYLQGASRNPNVYADGKRKVDSSYEGYAGYHYGYNPSLFAERVRDALTLVAMIRDNDKYRTERILVAGVEGAGVVAAAATALARETVSLLATDTRGFRFAGLASVWDPDFQPGAVKYGDVPAMLALCAPVRLEVAGETAKSAAAAAAAYAAVGASWSLAGGDGVGGVDAVVRALVGGK